MLSPTECQAVVEDPLFEDWEVALAAGIYKDARTGFGCVASTLVGWWRRQCGCRRSYVCGDGECVGGVCAVRERCVCGVCVTDHACSQQPARTSRLPRIRIWLILGRT
jgi:hypothetical protein